jgi:hypothetical protein
MTTRLKSLLIGLLFAVNPLFSQWQLSDEGEIHIVTCGPYQGELYSAFGHSAIRVTDPRSGIDLIYNYGVFDFNQPNFYLNFARGYLNYRLAVSSYQGFRNYYVSENRFIHEQVLHLDHGQKQAVFNFLQWNALPENRDYLYDYFYDNCATRVRDVFTSVLGDSLLFDSTYVSESYTVRQLCDMYLGYQPWGDLGIDLCLGLPMDKVMEPYEYMFLPDYVETGFNQVQIRKSGQWRPIVKKTLITYQPAPEDPPSAIWNPGLFFWALFAIVVLISFIGYRRKKLYLAIDIILFSITGLVGWLLLLLWLLTDHNAAAMNLNLLWANPLHFPLVIVLAWGRHRFLGFYFRIFALIYLVVLIFWTFLPQDLHFSLIPLVLLLFVRATYVQFHQLSDRDSVSME